MQLRDGEFDNYTECDFHPQKRRRIEIKLNTELDIKLNIILYIFQVIKNG